MSRRPMPQLARRVSALVLSFLLVCTLLPASAVAEALERATADTEEDTAAYVEGQALVLYRVEGEDAVAAYSAAADEPDAEPLEEEGFEVEATWDFSTVDEVAEQAAEVDEDAAALEETAQASDVPTGDDLRVAVVTSDDLSTEELVAELQDLECVEVAQPNYRLESASAGALPSIIVNLQWHLSEDTGIDLEAAAALDVSADADEVVVAVIDTGVDYTHEDLAGLMWELTPELAEVLPGTAGCCGYDYVSNDDDPMPSDIGDDASHGTKIAGVIASEATDATRIMALKAGTGVSGTLTSAALVQSYEYVIAARLAGVNVVAANCSFSDRLANPIFDYMVNQAGRLGVLTVTCAGNNEEDTSSFTSPDVNVCWESPFAIVVASSNEAGLYSKFSNWGATQVDLAAPGSLLLTTVPLAAGSLSYDPSVSAAKGTALCSEDFSGFLGRAQLLAAGEYPDPSAGPCLALVDWSTGVSLGLDQATVSSDGPGVQVTVAPEDFSAVLDEGMLTLIWDAENPFAADSTLDPAECAAGALLTLDAEPGLFFAVDLVLCTVEEDGSSGTVLGRWALSQSTDQCDYYEGGFYDSVDLSVYQGADDLRFELFVASHSVGTTTDEPVTIGIQSCSLGTLDDAPYGLASGTSFSAPVVVGAIARLSSAAPELSALDLRGLVVGSTEAMKEQHDENGALKETATDGRFTYAPAVDALSGYDVGIQANTWACTADSSEGTATLYGYDLDDVTAVTVDGTTAEIVSADSGTLVVTVADEDFDGSYHRIDVVDGSTSRVHKASYQLESSETAQGTLELVCDLPVENAATGTLVAGPDELFFVDSYGTYLYQLTDAEQSLWEELPAPGLPDGLACKTNTPIVFCYENGVLHAFSAREAEEGYELCEATLANGDEAWSDFQGAGTIPGVPYGVTGGTWDGQGFWVTVWNASSRYGTHSLLFYSEKGSGEFYSVAVLPNAHPIIQWGLPFSDAGTSWLTTAYDEESGTGLLSLYVWDDNEGWFSGYSVDDPPTWTGAAWTTFMGLANGTTQHGLLVAGVSGDERGDLVLVQADGSLEWFGYWGLTGTDGFSATSVAQLGSALYLTALGTNDAQGSLYRLPDEAAEACGDANNLLAAAAVGDGTATVSDWRGGGSDELSVRRGDWAVWTAVADEGAEFLGWYRGDALFSKETTVAGVPMANIALTARFSETDDQIEPDDTDPDDGEGDNTGTVLPEEPGGIIEDLEEPSDDSDGSDDSTGAKDSTESGSGDLDDVMVPVIEGSEGAAGDDTGSTEDPANALDEADPDAVTVEPDGTSGTEGSEDSGTTEDTTLWARLLRATSDPTAVALWLVVVAAGALGVGLLLRRRARA